MFDKFVDGFYSIYLNYFVWKKERLSKYSFLSFFNVIELETEYGYKSIAKIYSDDEFVFSVNFESYFSLFELIKRFQNRITEPYNYRMKMDYLFNEICLGDKNV